MGRDGGHDPGRLRWAIHVEHLPAMPAPIGGGGGGDDSRAIRALQFTCQSRNFRILRYVLMTFLGLAIT